MNDIQLTVVGHLTADPQTRSTTGGAALTTMRIGTTSRFYDRVSGEWKDGNTVFLSVSCWRTLAVHAAQALRKGDRVVALGRLRQREYTVDEQLRVRLELEAEHVGVDLGRVPVVVQRPVPDRMAVDRSAEAAPADEDDGSAEGAADGSLAEGADRVFSAG